MWGRATKLEGGIRRNLSRRRRGSHSARRGRDSARMFERVTSVAQKPRATPSNALEPVPFEPRRAPLRRTIPALQSKACLFRRIDPPYVRGARDAVGDAAHSPRHQINVPIHRSIDPSIHRPIDSSTHRSIARVSHTVTSQSQREHDQRRGHHRHPDERAVGDVFVVRVVLERRGEELLQRDVHHHPVERFGTPRVRRTPKSCRHSIPYDLHESSCTRR